MMSVMMMVMVAVMVSFLLLQQRIRGLLLFVEKVLLLVYEMNCGRLRWSVVGPRVVV
jgi:hypothetical protein